MKESLEKASIQAESITLGDYRKFIKTTNKYPEDKMLDCLLLGVAEECIEALMAMNMNSGIDVDKENGDILWYSFSILNYFETDITKDQDVIEAEKHVPVMLPLSAKNAISAIKKFNRGDFSLDEKRVKALRIAYNNIGQLQDIYGDEFELLMGLNVYKLKNRTKNNTIKGEGDDR